MEVRQYVEEIYWIDEIIEIPEEEEHDIEDYIKNGKSVYDYDTSNSQKTVQDEEKTIELIEIVREED